MSLFLLVISSSLPRVRVCLFVFVAVSRDAKTAHTQLYLREPRPDLHNHAHSRL